ncbi:CinA family nicotinamide mononucleotide deamidase-related protein [Ornithobacterium rhinotracheale]|uniref:CinA-like protein n=1 Tax=Ornithobacterium rhinotracheale TaxID=28251 RepID=A0A410JU42_ORNRH|nr:CinA family nicotinamide mononucleotide deamidase-related protein [Ornithobacterium rhinotracheale]QAR31558.1 CinA family nicotinamide mononucleotide deamidase-related protein [Ornithobacterium rhinotracheale]
MKSLFAHIISIGDEVLLGDTLDTNAHFIAKQLNKINVQLNEISVIHDEEATIQKKIKEAALHADIIITTGGLGPTRDDKTKFVVADLLGEKLVMNEQALAWVEEHYAQNLRRSMNELTRNQALLPENSEPLRNQTGTACGIWSKYQNSVIINLPGVPVEMRHLMQTQVIPKIKKDFLANYRLHKYVRVYDVPESELAIILSDFENEMPENVKLAYLPKNSRIKMRFTGIGKDFSVLEKQLEDLAQKLKNIIPNNVYAENEQDMPERLKDLCLEKSLKIATAESFTAGLVSHRITSVSGSSGYFMGSLVAYDPQIKIQELGVSAEVVKTKGVVNEEVAIQMAKGAVEKFKADFAVSTTGVAGPNKDDFGNEVGLAYIGIASKQKATAIRLFYPHYERAEFTDRMADMAIEQLMNFILKEA